jgi:hypothetical protein
MSACKCCHDAPEAPERRSLAERNALLGAAPNSITSAYPAPTRPDMRPVTEERDDGQRDSADQ